VYAKLHAEAAAAEAVRRRSSAVSEALAEAGAGLDAAAPFRRLGGDHALLYHGVGADPLPLSLASAARAGAALRRLHALPPTLLPPRASAGVEEEAAAVLRAAAHIDALLPNASCSLRATVDRAVELGRAGEDETAVVHGDCKLAHFLGAPSGLLLLIDLDRCHRGDPALDLGKLAADLRFHHVAAGRSGAEDAVLALLAAYGATPGADRARAYQALLLLKIAARRVPLFDPRWTDTTRAVVAAAAAVLEQPRRRRRPPIGVAS
jgi:aminoglycoside phosphotransferase (APT) family kinase protein